MRVLERMNISRASAFECTAESLEHQLRTAHDQGNPLLYNEILKAGTATKVYFDFDKYLDEPPSQQALDADLQVALTDANKVLQSAGRTPEMPEPDFAIAHRHGPVVDDKGVEKHKVSFRMFATNYAVTNYTRLGYLVKGTCMDDTVYKVREQLLNLVLCRKKANDPRVLRPLDKHLARPLHHFFASHLTDDETLLDIPPAPTRRNRKVPTSVPEGSETGATGSEVPLCDDVTKLLNLLQKTRWDRYNDWINIGIALKNIGSEAGDPNKYRQTWVRMSAISPKFDAVLCESKWDSFCNHDFSGAHGPLSLNSIENWASIDSPEGYADYRALTLPAFVTERCVQHSHRGLAEVAHFLLKDVIKRCGGSLYYFDPELVAWVKRDEGELSFVLSHRVEKALKDMQALLRMRLRAAIAGSDTCVQASIEADLKVVGDRIAWVKTQSGMNSLIHLATPLFRADGFEQLLDSVPYLLGVKNGVVDLRTGELRARLPQDNVYTLCPCEYDPQADPSVFHNVLLGAMADDEEMTRYLQRLLGYGITGDVSQEVFPVLTGNGRNCKGLLTQTMARLFGGFYKDINSGLIVERQVSNIDAERGKLLGARIAVFNELRDGDKLKTNEVQLLSGGDGIPARPLYKDPMTIQPRHLCILSTNHMPLLSDVIPAIEERLLCINFPVTFTDLEPGELPSLKRRQADKGLKAMLAEHSAAVLKWFVDGAVAWYANKDLKLSAPAKVKNCGREYLDSQDLLGSFIQSHCRRGGGLRVSTTAFLQRFTNYIELMGSSSEFNNRKLVSAMKTKGFTYKNGQVGTSILKCFFGLELKPLSEVVESD
jgi:P4 family phage/plasmid primase-like protien